MPIDVPESLQTQNIFKKSVFVIDPRPPGHSDKKLRNDSPLFPFLPFYN